VNSPCSRWTYRTDGLRIRGDGSAAVISFCPRAVPARDAQQKVRQMEPTLGLTDEGSRDPVPDGPLSRGPGFLARAGTFALVAAAGEASLALPPGPQAWPASPSAWSCWQRPAWPSCCPGTGCPAGPRCWCLSPIPDRRWRSPWPPGAISGVDIVLLVPLIWRAPVRPQVGVCVRGSRDRGRRDRRLAGPVGPGCGHRAARAAVGRARRHAGRGDARPAGQDQPVPGGGRAAAGAARRAHGGPGP
jgi:hypothetical protein